MRSVGNNLVRSVIRTRGDRSRLLGRSTRLAAVLFVCAGILVAPSAVAASGPGLGIGGPVPAEASDTTPPESGDAGVAPESEPDAPVVVPSAPPEGITPPPSELPEPPEDGDADGGPDDAVEDPSAIEGDGADDAEEVVPESSPPPPPPPAEPPTEPGIVVPDTSPPPDVAPAPTPAPSTAPLPPPETVAVEVVHDEATGAPTSSIRPEATSSRPDHITKQRPRMPELESAWSPSPSVHYQPSGGVAAPQPLRRLTAAAVSRPTTETLPSKPSIVEPVFAEWNAATEDRQPSEASPGELVVATGVVAMAPRVTTTVSVAMDFARLSGGWAGPLVFNVWLRRQVRERRLSQRQLAAMSGVNHSTISRLINDNRTPSLKTAAKLVHALRLEWTDEQVATYFDLLPERSLFPTQRVESALRGDTDLDDGDVRVIMEQYLVLRRRRRRQAPGGDALADRRGGTRSGGGETATGG